MFNKYNSKKPTKHDAEIKKLKRMYENYGINTSDMSEEEFERLHKKYKNSGKNLDEDLKASEKYYKVYDDDIIG
jgi:hypothetical protein